MPQKKLCDAFGRKVSANIFSGIFLMIQSDVSLSKGSVPPKIKYKIYQFSEMNAKMIMTRF